MLEYRRGILSQGDGELALNLSMYGYVNPSIQQIIEYAVTNNRGYMQEPHFMRGRLFTLPITRIHSEEDHDLEIKGRTFDRGVIDSMLDLGDEHVRDQEVLPMREGYERIPMFLMHEAPDVLYLHRG